MIDVNKVAVVFFLCIIHLVIEKSYSIISKLYANIRQAFNGVAAQKSALRCEAAHKSAFSVYDKRIV